MVEFFCFILSCFVFRGSLSTDVHVLIKCSYCCVIGVTLWEMFSYGKRPYENTHAVDLPELLEKGRRLPQPEICSWDLYLLMCACECE